MNSLELFLETAQAEGMQYAVPFVKLHGLGNDFVIVHERDLVAAASDLGVHEENLAYTSALAAAICDRHFGIGADGLILARETLVEGCALGWLYINSDGSRAEMCGNGLRCLAFYAVRLGLAPASSFSVDTAIGAVPVVFESADRITTDLGEPILEPGLVPVAQIENSNGMVVAQELKTKSADYKATCVSMGNPHCVIFESELRNSTQLLREALDIQASPVFPAGVNVEFVTSNRPDHARVYVVERGCGPTLACATGAAAVLVAGVLERRLNRTATIELPGGALQVSWSASDNRVRIQGPATVAFEGVFDLKRYFKIEGART